MKAPSKEHQPGCAKPQGSVADPCSLAGGAPGERSAPAAAPGPTPQWVEQLATLSSFRDRELLDVSLAGVLRDLLQPQSVAVVRCVGKPGDERWLVRARLGLHDRAAVSEGSGLLLEALPRLDSAPARLVCLQQRRVTQTFDTAAAAAGPGPHITRFPLASDLAVVGVLELHSLQRLGAPEQRMVASVLRLYGNVLALLDYSERDTLTGLLNRKTFDESFLRLAGSLAAAVVKATAPSAAEAGPDAVAVQLGEDGEIADVAVPADPGATPGEISVTPRLPVQGMALWLGVLDIDHFKRVNDTHGHLIGDEVLLLVSRLMRGSFRFDDQLYRFGGEEFVVLLRCASARDAERAFERFRSHVQTFDFPRAGHITVSVGFTQVRAEDTPSSAFERADQAVYVAKQRGRNQVQEHAALVAAGVLHEAARDGDVELF